MKLTGFFLIGILVWSVQVNAQSERAPIAIPFTLKEAGYVTLVIEDSNGRRVRNLTAGSWFKAGQNTVWWDGLDDLGRDTGAAGHGVYRIPSKLVSPGRYTVRGLVHGEIKTTYEFSVYSPGDPPWGTSDHTGGWLANHTPPQAALFVPAGQSPSKQPVVYLGCYITEGPDGLARVDLDGKKQGGKKWVGGSWTAAPYLARDAGEKAVAGIYAYVGSVWETGKASGQLELRISGLTVKADKRILVYPIGSPLPNVDKQEEIAGLAVHNGIAVVSLKARNKLVFIEVKSGKVTGTTTVTSPRGLAFEASGNLLVLSANKLLRFNQAGAGSSPATVISSGLENPAGLTLDREDKVYISDGGKSNQVKVFNASGKFIHAIGKAGTAGAGPYNPMQMNNPVGITIDSRQQLWVTENDYLPKRVSIWSLEGNLIKAFYGPAKYGGGGTLDPQDKTLFYYSEGAKGAMEFKLDWKTGAAKLQRVFYRRVPGSLKLAMRSSGPETPLYYKGKRYFTDCYNSSPTGGHPIAFLFSERNGVAYPSAAAGRADAWDILKGSQFRPGLPSGTNLKAVFFIWTDLNEDAQVQPNEVTFRKGNASGVTVMPDLSFCFTQLDHNAVQFSPVSFTAGGIPVYQAGQGKVLVKGVSAPGSSGGNQVLTTTGGWTVVTQGILPFERFSLSGAKDGKAIWSYPSLWPGLHASHEAPLPEFPGELIGTTRLLGGMIGNKESNSGPLWAINSNHGMVYLFTADGLYVTTLFEPMRTGKRWSMASGERGMDLKGVSLGEENFWPSITQTSDGQVYLVDGARSALIRVDGLVHIERLPAVTVTVSSTDLEKSRAFQAKTESARQQQQGKGLLKVVLQNSAMVVDGKWEDWKGTEWANIDTSGIKAYFNSKSRPYKVTGAVAVSGNKLYVGYRTGDRDLLKNSGEISLAPFKTGGALDVMIGANAAADPKRVHPVAGDIRLLVTLVKGKPYALVYRAVVNGTREGDKVPFSSPSNTVTFDRVDNISGKIGFAAGKDGDFEISVPLDLLALKPVPGMVIQADIGVLRGDGGQTLSRTYWNNKGTAIVSDVPSEAVLTPNLWGKWKFVN
jgi:hypothetical protein